MTHARKFVLSLSVAVAATTLMAGCWWHAGPDRGRGYHEDHHEEHHDEHHDERR
jgi:Spy/CpxP family protein refolding chaperone